MANTKRARKLELQQRIRDLRSEGVSRADIANIVNVSDVVVASALEFFDETEKECGWDSVPHYASDHRQCRLRRE